MKKSRKTFIIPLGVLVSFLGSGFAFVSPPKILPLRQPCLKTELFRGKTLRVFTPETPRVPHHLAIAFHRKEICTIADVNKEENEELFATFNKISEIYKTIQIQGFVVAFKHDLVEIIPHLPGFHEIKNIADKMDCNRHVLFPELPLSRVVYPIDKEYSAFWKEAFQKPHPPLDESDWKITYPHTRKESHHKEADKIVEQHLEELLHGKEPAPIPMPTELSEVKSITVASCPFCNPEIVEKQLVYEYESVLLFYNIRKSAKPASQFLILPKRHTERVYGLTPKEIEDFRIARKALIEVLQETHPGCEVVLYIQDTPSVGQTVFHSHEQVISLAHDPQTTALNWLQQGGNVSDEEMRQVRSDFRAKLREKIEQQIEKSA